MCLFDETLRENESDLEQYTAKLWRSVATHSPHHIHENKVNIAYFANLKPSLDQPFKKLVQSSYLYQRFNHM